MMVTQQVRRSISIENANDAPGASRKRRAPRWCFVQKNRLAGSHCNGAW